MVRLVFRPYTRLRRSICTSESLRTSTRVSPGFVLAGHRSPSFGSQHVRSRCACPGAGKPTPFTDAPGMRRRSALARATDGSPLSERKAQAFAFTAPWCLLAPRLAHMLDSLVRVSRRVEWNHNQTRRRLRRAPPNATAATRDQRGGNATGSPEDSDRIARHYAAATAMARRDAPQRASTGPAHAQKTTVGGQTTAHPKGLRQSAPPKQHAPHQPAHRIEPRRA